MTTISLQMPRTTAVSVTARGLAGTSPVTLDAATLAAWAMRIDTDGIGAHEERARSMVTAASQLGLCPVLVDVLADAGEPAVARERAFGRLALALMLLH